MKKITIVSGTNRRGSNTRRICDHLAGLFDGLGSTASILDLVGLPTSILSPDAYETRPAEFQPFQDAVSRADGLVIVIPEYNGGPPGVAKLWLDFLDFPESFEGLPACFIGVSAGEWGGLRPVEQLQIIFGYRGAHVYPQRVFVREVDGKFDAEGGLADPELKARLAKQAKGFVEFVRLVKG